MMRMRISTRSVLLNVIFVIVAVAATSGFILVRIYDETNRLAGVVQESRLNTFWELLESKGTDFKIVDGKLMVGDHTLNDNYELPDKIQKVFGGTATIFMGDTRISTNVLKPDGSRAVGTKLQGAAYDAIFKEGKPYRGETMILNVPYFTAYDPIRNSKGEIIGVLYVGVKKSDYFEEYDKIMKSIIAMTLLLAVLLSSIAGFVVRRSLLPLRAMIGALREITNGSQGVTALNRRLDASRNDEISELGKEINNLLEKMHRIMSMVSEATAKVNLHAETISTAVDRHADFASQLSSSAMEISTTMEEFNSTATQIAQHSHGVADIASRTLENTKEGASGVRTLTMKVNEISEDNVHNLKEILDLGAKSREITKIMEIINDIADQTKLIAFNATLEASSAGEVGKRFGVVASEIRRLADSVVRSTAEIERKITEIQDAVNRLVISSEKSSKVIQEGIEYSGQTVSMLDGVLGGAKSTTEAAKQISLSTRQQQSASDQVVLALRDIQEGTQHSFASIQQIRAISAELAEISEHLNKLVDTVCLSDA